MSDDRAATRAARVPAPARPTAGRPARPRIAGLDGLRALAVVGVLLYHADVTWMPGGFIGVDIFFVLSGFLVASIVLESVSSKGFLDIGRFWSARMRRLAPAQIALIVVVSLALAVAFRDELDELRGQVIAALTGTTNWYLIVTERSYFDQAGRPPVFRHLWSLAIELQFYLVFPPILVLALRRAGDRLDRIVGAILAAALCSTIYLAVLYHPGQDPTRAYFDTFARLAAPLLGAALALVWRPRALARAPIGARGREVAIAGGVAVLALVWLMHVAGDRSAFMYRGGFLLTALLATVAVAALVHPGSPLGGPKGFGHPVLVAIGLRSYGLYLWHWPVFDLLRPRIDVGWSWGVVFVVRILVTVALTEACYRLVERPWHLRSPSTSVAGIRARLEGRDGAIPAVRYASWAAVVATLVATVVIVIPHPRTDDIGDALRAGQDALDASGVGAERGVTTTTTTAPKADGGATTTTVTVPDDGRVTLVGDSVMVGAAPSLIEQYGDDAIIDAKVSRQAGVLAPIVQQLLAEGRLGSTVVVQVGINGTVTEEELRAIVDAAAGRRVFIINARVPRSWETSNNETVKRVVPRLPRAKVIDWYAASNGHRDWFLGDGVHLTPDGRDAYARLIKRATDKA